MYLLLFLICRLCYLFFRNNDLETILHCEYIKNEELLIKCRIKLFMLEYSQRQLPSLLQYLVFITTLLRCLIYFDDDCTLTVEIWAKMKMFRDDIKSKLQRKYIITKILIKWTRRGYIYNNIYLRKYIIY